ncbi:MAG TPA: MATE family efflux transporter [Candidatus Anaerofilum excrementigallinarum]|nr:MATE family efflux transporter [Candidatus Anaerofilum excrementigallinarum]
MHRDLTSGPITRTMLLFALPMTAGNLLQQLYNLVDTLIVGRFLGAGALAAVGSAYSLMTFLTSIFLGLCMGSGTIFAIRWGEKDTERLQSSIYVSFVLIAGITIALNVGVFVLLDPILALLRTPAEVWPLLRQYLQVVFLGIGASFLYNYFACLLRAVGDSVTPLVFLAVSAVLNIVLDLVLVVVIPWGVAGAAAATAFSQWVSALGLLIFARARYAFLWPQARHRRMRRELLGEISQFSLLTCVQQSVMNFGILMVQGLVNSFGTVVMAAFAAGVKIDSFAYMPVQDFGNAFSTFIAQNYGAGKSDRIRRGIRSAVAVAVGFSVAVSALVFVFAGPLMGIFVPADQPDIIAAGMDYLRIEGAFYAGIGCLFLLYGYFRAVQRPGISVALTVISLGTRVLLAYALSALPGVGVTGIWWSVPIGWFLADAAGLIFYRLTRKTAKIG